MTSVKYIYVNVYYMTRYTVYMVGMYMMYILQRDTCLFTYMHMLSMYITFSKLLNMYIQLAICIYIYTQINVEYVMYVYKYHVNNIITI